MAPSGKIGCGIHTKVSLRGADMRLRAGNYHKPHQPQSLDPRQAVTRMNVLCVSRKGYFGI